MPPQRTRAAPWSGWEILAIVFCMMFLWPATVGNSLNALGIPAKIYGEDFANRLQESQGGKQKNNQKVGSNRKVVLLRWSLLVQGVSFPFVLITFYLVLALFSQAQPYQFGLTTQRLLQNILLGVLACLALTPPVYGILYLVSHPFEYSPEMHPLHEVIGPGLQRPEQLLVLFTAVVMAPVQEELFFRGTLQPWLRRNQATSLLSAFLALGLALFYRQDQLGASLVGADWHGVGTNLLPAAFVVVVAPGFWLCRLRPRPESTQAILGSSLLFAMAHSSVWPSPVPLFFLGLGLGWLASRTQSVVGPIVCHALFNSVACVLMF